MTATFCVLHTGAALFLDLALAPNLRARLNRIGVLAIGLGLPFGNTASKVYVTASADASESAYGHSYKRRLQATGTAAREFMVLQAEYYKVDGDGWQNMALAICPIIDTKNWMLRLPGNLGLSHFTIPGTHDSGARARSEGIGVYHTLSVTQIWTLEQQLRSGIRFLDIRLNKDNNYEIVHGIDGTGLHFEKDCVGVIAKFLEQDGPKETILLSISSEKGTTDGFHDGVLDILNRVLGRRRLFTGANPGTLSTLRGTVVLVRRYWIDPKTNSHRESDKATCGLDLHGGFPASSHTFDELGDGKFQTNPDNLKFAIQDWYDLQTSYYTAKVKLVEKYLDWAAKSPQDVWFVNFTSCGTSSRVGKPADFAKGDTELNASLFRYLITHPSREPGGQRAAAGAARRYGLVIMDFSEFPEGLIELLINTDKLWPADYPLLGRPGY